MTYNLQIPDMQILLDGGSQQSYMMERARRVLKIDSEGEQQLSISAFGSARGSPKACPIVNHECGNIIEGIPQHDCASINFVVPMICEPLISQPIDVCINQNPHLTGIGLRAG